MARQREVEDEVAVKEAALRDVLVSRTRGDEEAASRLRRELAERDKENARLKAQIETDRLLKARAPGPAVEPVPATAAPFRPPGWRMKSGCCLRQVVLRRRRGSGPSSGLSRDWGQVSS